MPAPTPPASPSPAVPPSASPSASPSAGAARPRGELPRTLGLFSAIAVVVGTTIGSGIFRSPAGIADRLPGPLPLIGVWITGGLFALCGALTLAELAGALPRTGGVYVYIREGWGRLPAFLFGWTELLIIRAAALGAISITFAEYLWRAFGTDPVAEPYATYARFTAAGVILLMSTINVFGMVWGALVQNVTTIAKYGGLVMIVLFAAALGLPKTGGYYTPAVPEGSISFGAFGLALVSVLWAFDGWQDLSKVGGEVRNPERNLPYGLVLGTLAIIAIYVLVNLAYMAVLPVDEIRRSPLVAADVAERVLGPFGVTFVAATVLVSTFGSVNGSLLTGPRVFFALADDGLFFQKVAAVHPRYGTPYVAIGLAAALGVAFVLLRSFEQLADTFVTASLVFYILSVSAIFPLRRRADWNPPVKTPLYPLVPLVFIGATLLLFANALADPASRWGVLAVFGVILAGVPVYWLTVGKRG